MPHVVVSSGSNKRILSVIAIVLAIYAISIVFGAPQHGARLIKDAVNSHHADGNDEKTTNQGGVSKDDASHDAASSGAAASVDGDGDETTGSHFAASVQDNDDLVTVTPPANLPSERGEGRGLVEDGDKAGTEADQGGEKEFGPPPIWMVIPFAALLLCIAILPLLPATEHWWESNLHRFYVVIVLGVCTLSYYVFKHPGTVELHWPAHQVFTATEHGGLHLAWAIIANAILHEYIPFIMLLFSLYTISGGIRIEGDLKAHALTNSTFILIGGLLASFIGTTGAAMLLIRPLLETNRERKHVTHTVVIFIFVVCNCGGCLLPIGDPPLFLGYLRGVSFIWTFKLWAPWLMVNASLIAIYFVWDHFYYYPKEMKKDIARDETRTHRLRFAGLWPNIPLLLGIILSVALLDPSKQFPGTDWHPWIYLREIAQLGLIGLSLCWGSDHVRKQNKFNYNAILEVAILFFGIFLCMQPALQILGHRGSLLGVTQPMAFFWATGGLSTVLDNAPTYAAFFEMAKALPLAEGAVTVPIIGGQISETRLIAISLGAVFMGAMTYIGNGPNFMVRAIAERSGVKMPGFFGYMIYSCCILLPILVLMTLIFL